MGRRQKRDRGASMRAGTVALSAAALVLSGCGAFSSPEKQLAAPVSEIAGALATSHTAVDQTITGRTAPTVAKTSLSEMLTDVTDATATISGLAVQTPKQSRLRGRALHASDDARMAILAAQEAQQKTGRKPGLEQALKRIDRARQIVEKISDDLPAPR